MTCETTATISTLPPAPCAGLSAVLSSVVVHRAVYRLPCQLPSDEAVHMPSNPSSDHACHPLFSHRKHVVAATCSSHFYPARRRSLRHSTSLLSYSEGWLNVAKLVISELLALFTRATQTVRQAVSRKEEECEHAVARACVKQRACAT